MHGSFRTPHRCTYSTLGGFKKFVFLLLRMKKLLLELNTLIFQSVFYRNSLTMVSFFQNMIIPVSCRQICAQMSLEALNTFLTAWGTYRTSVNLTVYPHWSFIFAVPFRSQFILWKFTTVTSIFNYSILVILFFMYVMCDDALLSSKNSLR